MEEHLKNKQVLLLNEFVWINEILPRIPTSTVEKFLSLCHYEKASKWKGKKNAFIKYNLQNAIVIVRSITFYRDIIF